MTVELTADQRAARVQWVRDLVSGNFKQGNAALVVHPDTEDEAFCCLGVAALQVGRDALYRDNPNDAFHQARGYIDEVVGRTVFGFQDAGYNEDESRYHDTDQHNATGWNDTKQLTFAQIADRVAYATEHGLRFDELNGDDAPRVNDGYAIEWLARQDAVSS